MKKRILRFILGCGYMGLLTLLLLSQLGAVTDAAGKWKAMLSAVLIGVPWVIVLKMYNRIADGDMLFQNPQDSRTQRKQKNGLAVKIQAEQEMRQTSGKQTGQENGQAVKMHIGWADSQALETYTDQDSDQKAGMQIEQGNIRDVHVLFESVAQKYTLTQREQEVAWLLYRGYTNRQIGEELFIAEATVKKHVSHVYEKVQVMGRKEFRAKIDHHLKSCRTPALHR